MIMIYLPVSFAHEFSSVNGIGFLPADPHRIEMVEIEQQGELLKITYPQSAFAMERRAKPNGSIRGGVTEFSAKSRKRLLELFARFDMPRLISAKQKPKFITLTYVENMQNYRLAKTHLDTLIKRLKRRFPAVWGVWRMELQERGAIHFHLIIGNMGYLHKTVLQDMWAEVIGQERPFTRIEAIRSGKGVMFYASKYVAKMPEEGDGVAGFNCVPYLTDNTEANTDNNPGRWWGLFGRQNLPLAEKINKRIVCTLATLETWIKMQPVGYPSLYSGYTLFCKNARLFAETLISLTSGGADTNDGAARVWRNLVVAERRSSDWARVPEMVKEYQQRKRHEYLLWARLAVAGSVPSITY